MLGSSSSPGVRGAIFAFGLALVPACTLAVSLDGLSGGPEPIDASTERDLEAATVEGAADARLSDGPAADGDADVPFCKTQSPAPAYCADFDTVADVAEGWDFTPGALGTVTLDKSAWVSSPASAFFTMSAGSASPSRTVRMLMHSMRAAAPTVVSLRFDVRLEVVDLSNQVHLATFNFGGTGSNYGAELAASRSTVNLVEGVPKDGGGATFVSRPLTVALPSTWTSVTMTLDFGSGRALVTIGGATAFDAPLAAGAFSTTRIDTSIGPAFYSISSVGSTAIRYDNVALTMK